MKGYSKLTDEELRVEVAKALGWTEICPCTEYHWGEPWSGFDGRLRGLPEDIPNFPNDLNACHEFAMALSNSDRQQFAHALQDVVNVEAERHGSEDLFYELNANGRQRCIALLMTLKPG